MNILNLSEERADLTLYSDTGIRIEPGESFYLGEEHGRDAILTLSEGERLLGLRDVSTAERQTLAKKGNALKDGSYPIANCSDAANAIRSQGRGGGSKPGVLALIKRRVKDLGCSGQIFEPYKS